MTDDKKVLRTGRPVDQQAVEALYAKMTRRRFTKIGLAAPLIMTLASQPAWACFSKGLSGGSVAGGGGAGGGGCPTNTGCTPHCCRRYPKTWCRPQIRTTGYEHKRKTDPDEDKYWKDCEVLFAEDVPKFSDLFDVGDDVSCLAMLIDDPNPTNSYECQAIAAYVSASVIGPRYGATPDEVVSAYRECLADPTGNKRDVFVALCQQLNTRETFPIAGAMEEPEVDDFIVRRKSFRSATKHPAGGRFPIAPTTVVRRSGTEWRG